MQTHVPPTAAAVYQLIPMAHVADVEASIKFYELLGFRVRNKLTHGGRTNWASLVADRGRLMLAAGTPFAPDAQAILFYLYTRDVAALRTHLLANGLADGGRYCGDPTDRRRVVFEIAHPDYMPEGEIRVADPDGYCLLIGQYELDE